MSTIRWLFFRAYPPANLNSSKASPQHAPTHPPSPPPPYPIYLRCFSFDQTLLLLIALAQPTRKKYNSLSTPMHNHVSDNCEQERERRLNRHEWPQMLCAVVVVVVVGVVVAKFKGWEGARGMISRTPFMVATNFRGRGGGDLVLLRRHYCFPGTIRGKGTGVEWGLRGNNAIWL